MDEHGSQIPEEYSVDQSKVAKSNREQAVRGIRTGAAEDSAEVLSEKIVERDSATGDLSHQAELAFVEASKIQADYDKILSGESEMTAEEIRKFRIEKLGQSEKRIRIEELEQLNGEKKEWQRMRDDLGSRISGNRLDGSSDEEIIRDIENTDLAILELGQSMSGASLLENAVYNKRQSVVEALLKKGVDPNRAFHMSTATRRDPVILKMLLDYGADPNHLNYRREPLIFTCARPGMAQILLEHGADVTAVDKNGNTALHHFSHDSQLGLNMIEFLVNNGADINVLNNHGETPIDVVTNWPSGVKKRALLLRLGAKSSREVQQGSN